MRCWKNFTKKIKKYSKRLKNCWELRKSRHWSETIFISYMKRLNPPNLNILDSNSELSLFIGIQKSIRILGFNNFWKLLKSISHGLSSGIICCEYSKYFMKNFQINLLELHFNPAEFKFEPQFHVTYLWQTFISSVRTLKIFHEIQAHVFQIFLNLYSFQILLKVPFRTKKFKTGVVFFFWKA